MEKKTKAEKPKIHEVGTKFALTAEQKESMESARAAKDAVLRDIGALEVDYEVAKQRLAARFNAANNAVTETCKMIALAHGVNLTVPEAGVWSFPADVAEMVRSS